MIECAVIGALSGLVVFGMCQFIRARRLKAKAATEAIRVWEGKPLREERPICLYDPHDPIGGTRIRVSSRPKGE